MKVVSSTLQRGVNTKANTSDSSGPFFLSFLNYWVATSKWWLFEDSNYRRADIFPEDNHSKAAANPISVLLTKNSALLQHCRQKCSLNLQKYLDGSHTIDQTCDFRQGWHSGRLSSHVDALREEYRKTVGFLYFRPFYIIYNFEFRIQNSLGNQIYKSEFFTILSRTLISYFGLTYANFRSS